MKLRIYGGLVDAAQYGMGAEITLDQAVLDGYRVWIDPDGWYRGDPTSRCRWAEWKASPVAPAAAPAIITNPECRSGKHTNCDGNGWDTRLDAVCDCPCDCHEPKGTEL